MRLLQLLVGVGVACWTSLFLVVVMTDCRFEALTH